MIATATESPSYLGAMFLGLLQGLTEFLPVSSSGHLVLFQQFISVGTDHILFDLILHLGTLIPVVWFYRSDVFAIAKSPFVGEKPLLQRDGIKMAAFLILATIPTGLIGVIFKDTFELWFSNSGVLVVTFAITGGLMFASRFLSGARDLTSMMWYHAVILGLAQGFAITPGISRSGTTIVVAMLLGFSPIFAARFSFLMSIPAILGAVVLKAKDVDAVSLDWASLATGGLTALVSGYAALVFLVYILKNRRLSHFSYYCWFMALVAAAVTFWPDAQVLPTDSP